MMLHRHFLEQEAREAAARAEREAAEAAEAARREAEIRAEETRLEERAVRRRGRPKKSGVDGT